MMSILINKPIIKLSMVPGKVNPVVKLLLALMAALMLMTLTGCSGHFTGFLNPKGIVAYEERKLFFNTLALMLIVVLPVIVMSLAFIYHYRASHKSHDYKPNWGHSFFLESLWWGIPCVIILVLSILTWKKTHELDPFRKISGYDSKPMIIQVIALPWKWLFIYPQHNIASINELVIPVGQQVEYWITADNVPMSSFFIPQLGSQIYAMAGMRTRLHLVPNTVGIYDGMNTQFNGEGFSDMHFTVMVVDAKKMEDWVAGVKKSDKQLSEAAYGQLLNPSIKDKPRYFSGVSPDLFNRAIDIYMHTYGTAHPRNNQIKMQYPLKQGE